VENRAREHWLGEFIERLVLFHFPFFNSDRNRLFSAKAEESARREVANFYNSYKSNVLNKFEKSSSLVCEITRQTACD